MKILGFEIFKKEEVKEETVKKDDDKKMTTEEFRKVQLANLRDNAVGDLNELTVDKDGIVDQAKAVKTILDMELDNERLDMEKKEKEERLKIERERLEVERKEKFWKTVTFVVVGGVTVAVTILDYKLTKEFAGNVWDEQMMDKVVAPKLQQQAGKLKDTFAKDVNGLKNKTFNRF